MQPAYLAQGGPASSCRPHCAHTALSQNVAATPRTQSIMQTCQSSAAEAGRECPSNPRLSPPHWNAGQGRLGEGASGAECLFPGTRPETAGASPALGGRGQRREPVPPCAALRRAAELRAGKVVWASLSLTFLSPCTPFPTRWRTSASKGRPIEKGLPLTLPKLNNGTEVLLLGLGAISPNLPCMAGHRSEGEKERWLLTERTGGEEDSSFSNLG